MKHKHHDGSESNAPTDSAAPGASANPGSAATTAPATPAPADGWSPAAGGPPARAKSRTLLVVALWIVGFLAVILAAVYVAMLPGMHEADAYGLLDRVRIDIQVVQKADREGKAAPKPMINPVTGKTVGDAMTVFVGEFSETTPNLEARHNFIALTDLCGREPELAMKVMRKGLYDPMADEAGYRRRLVADEMLVFLRDVHEQFPGDPSMRLTIDDIYQVARITNGKQYNIGAGRHAADIASYFLAFPADAPKEVTAYDLDATGENAFTRTIFFKPGEFGGKTYCEPFFEQGPDCLIFLNTFGRENFTWDDTIKRFLYKGSYVAPKPVRH